MTEKAKNDLTIELMRRYNIKPDDDKAEFTPPKPPSDEAASDPFYSSPAPASTQDTAADVNPLLKIQEEEDRKKQEKAPENVLQRNEGLAEVGGVLGGAAQYKSAGQNLLKPATDLFTQSNPSMPGGQRIEPTFTAPMSDVEHTMQSGQGQRPGETGRQRENTHNQETQRQALAAKQNLQLPGAANVVVNAGPMYTTESGVSIPKATATQLEQQLQAKQAAEAEQRRQLLEKQAIEQQRVQQQQARRAKAIGAAQGTGRVAQGVVGGALAAPQLYEYGRDVIRNDKTKPADTTQGLSGLGGLIMALGRGKAGPLGAAMQVPYIVKNRDEIARSMNMSDINPTAFMGMPDEFSGINTPLQPRLKPKQVNDGYGPLRQLPP
jgi:hypothetical protein